MSDNRNKNFAGRKTYQTRQSPYRISDNKGPAPVKASRPLQTPGLSSDTRDKTPKRDKINIPDKRDADPKHRILKDRVDDEYVVRFYRRSKWQILYLSFIPAVLTLITLISFVASALLPYLSIIFVPLLIITVGWWIWTIVDWSNDYLIVTNRRFIYIEKVVLFEQTRTEIRTSEFVEVKLLAKRGSLEYAFQIGAITIQGKNGTIRFTRVAQPLKVFQEIDKDYKDYRMARRKERDAMMDSYFMSKATNKAPERPPYLIEIPYLPANVSFFKKIRLGLPILSTDEMKRQQLVWHKHPFILFKLELLPLGLSILYILALVLFGPVLLLAGGGISIVTILAAVLLGAFLAALLWYRYALWDNDVYTLNTEEVVDSEKLPFGFNEFKDRIKLNNVQDIKFDKFGFFSNILNYGSVMVDRTGGNKPLTFTNVPEPDLIQQQIGRWVRTRVEIIESLDDERQVDFLIRHRHNLRHLLEDN